MTGLRWILAVVIVAATATTVALLGVPGWSVPPAVVVVAAAVSYPVVAARGRRRPSWTDAAVAVSAGALSVVTAVTALVGADGNGGAADRDEGSVTATARETVRTLFTFGPADFTAEAAQRRARELTPLLTGRLLSDYRSQGPDVVLPAAVASRATVTTTVEEIGVGDAAPDMLRLLVFATERITVASATPPTSTVPIVRWAVMRRVEESWRLADIYPAGIGG